MIKITIQIEGMQCGMCEAHINDVMRREFPVKMCIRDRMNGYPAKPFIGFTGV